ncbi:molybdopterin-guanine dinucleotide biosynthesis protein B [Heyndrickxia sp. MSNUG]|uniref:molybdopterin-guanine dinucleotide biosynthesis protein B n=1 Tax=Heyndrickxia sp. MSNUG TaxID=3136677 RepID=UPI003C2F5992
MALVKPIIFQIAGYQDSGKTTLSLKLIEHLSASGLKIATIKHHGHGGKPEVDETKDSGRHIAAGATVSLVEGDGRILIQAEQKQWSLLEEIEMLSFFKPEVILIEGYKNEKYPKAVILRDKGDLELLDILPGIKVIFYRDASMARHLIDQDIPSFDTSDESGFTWLTNYIKADFT